MPVACDRQRSIDDAYEPFGDAALAPTGTQEVPVAPVAPVVVVRRSRRTRQSFLIALGVVVVAWAAGLLGAWMGVRLAERAPARTPSTLGLVRAEPREQPLPALDVFSAASAIGPSVVHVSAITSNGALVGASTGSGVVLTTDGEIITNAHVVSGAETVSVRLPGETEPREAAVVAVDETRDLALLHIDADSLVPAVFADPDDVRVGDDVVVVGFALDLDGDPSVTVGIVSALGRANANETTALKGLIQTDAPISSGNSGGPLVNSLGQVVGLVTFVALGDGTITANSLGFAISNAELLPAVEVLRAAAGGEGQLAGFLGVSLDERRDGGSGAVVTEVLAGLAADDAGLEVGDVIVAIDEVLVTGPASLIATIRNARPGDEVVLAIRRDGRDLTATATLAERPAE